MTGEGDLGLTGGPQTYWLKGSSQLKCHVWLLLFPSSMLSEKSCSGTHTVLAMALRSDINKTCRRIARLFYWFPRSLTCSKNRKSRLPWSQGGGKLSEANASFEIHFFFPVTKMELPWSSEEKLGSQSLLKTLFYICFWGKIEKNQRNFEGEIVKAINSL